MGTQNISGFTQTWNNGATTFNAIKVNVTNSASAADSKLIALQIGGSSYFYVDKSGDAVLTGYGADAAVGPSLTLHRDSASPADDDILGEIKFDGEDDGSNQTTYARIYAQAKDVTDTTEDGELVLQAMAGGTLTTLLSLSASSVAITTSATLSLTPAQQAQTRVNISASIKGHIYGLMLSNNATDATNDIDIAAGEAASTETNPVLMVLSSSLTKRLDAAWAVGTGNGGLDTGSIADTTYHVWLIRRSDTGVVDALFSTSATSPTMPTNYDQKRRIGSIIRASSAILAFVQDGDTFRLKTALEAFSFTNSVSTAVTRTLPGPVGIRVEAFGNIGVSNAAAANGHLLSDLSANDVAPAFSGAVMPQVRAASSGVATAPWRVFTNTSCQIRSRNETSNGDIVRGSFEGWIDTRGRV